MKVQISRFSPHQNGKVFAVLMALGSLLFVVPFMLFASFTAPPGQSFPFFMVVLFPIIYLVMGYLSVALGCWLYNAMFKHIGGIEFEHSAGEA